MTDKTEESDPLIPDVVGLTDAVKRQLAKMPEQSPRLDKLLALMKEDEVLNPTVEELLTRVRSLLNVSGKGVVRGFTSEELFGLDEQICSIISAEVSRELPDALTPYHELALWTRTIERSHPVHIFTSNYDLLMEQALEEASAPYFDGFIGGRRAFFDLGSVENEQLLHARWTRLWKIHGSLNWMLDSKKQVVRTELPQRGQSHLIYPSHLKYEQSRKMPFLAMLDRLKAFVLTPSSILFFCGYSFRDDDINDILSRALSNNPTAMSYAFLYGSLDEAQYEKAISLAKSTPNLTLCAFDKGVINRDPAPWSVATERLESISNGFVVSKGSSDSGKHLCELRLGCFATFGALLKDLSANEQALQLPK